MDVPSACGAIVIEAALAVVLTLGVYRLAYGVSRALGGHPLANPVLWGAALVTAALWALGIEVADYVMAARPLMAVLDLAIVALAVLLLDQLRGAGRRLLAALGALAVGSAAGMAMAIAGAKLLGLPAELQQALAVKNITSGIAISLMEHLGGPPPLAAGLVIATGMVGALTLPPLLQRMGMDADALGIGTGQAAHIVGTDALVRTSERAAANAALAMVVGGLIGAMLLPFAWRFVAG